MVARAVLFITLLLWIVYVHYICIVVMLTVHRENILYGRLHHLFAGCCYLLYTQYQSLITTKRHTYRTNIYVKIYRRTNMCYNTLEHRIRYLCICRNAFSIVIYELANVAKGRIGTWLDWLLFFYLYFACDVLCARQCAIWCCCYCNCFWLRTETLSQFQMKIY